MEQRVALVDLVRFEDVLFEAKALARHPLTG